jgi:hypothetical protein
MEIIEINPQEKKYTTVKSEYIKAKIRDSNWKDKFRRNYIDDLIELEENVLYGWRGWAHCLYVGALKDQYKREYNIIFKELKPKEYEQKVEAEKQRELESQEYWENVRKESKVKEERQRREWLEAGGTEQ